LEQDLAVAVVDGAAVLRLAGAVLADAGAADPDGLGSSVPWVSPSAAVAAEGRFAGLRSHPFPECFVCGTGRRPGDGMLLRPGPLGDGRSACTWTPDASLSCDGDLVEPAFCWAALDCPSGWAAGMEGRPMVLGQMYAAITVPPRIGERCVVVGSLRGWDGRKASTASTVYRESGQVCGQAIHTWVQVDPARFQ